MRCAGYRGVAVTGQCWNVLTLVYCMAKFQDQFARVRRFLQRIQTHNRSATDYDDDMWAFFQNCWHLKDWIKHDPEVPLDVRNTIEKDAQGSSELMVCADLANASKHLFLTTPRIGAKHSHKNYRVVIGGQSKVEYFIDVGDGSKIDGVALAHRCIAAWESILNKRNLAYDV